MFQGTRVQTSKLPKQGVLAMQRKALKMENKSLNGQFYNQQTSQKRWPVHAYKWIQTMRQAPTLISLFLLLLISYNAYGSETLQETFLKRARDQLARLFTYNLPGHRFTCRSLKDVTFTNANLAGASFPDHCGESTEVTNADFRRARLMGVKANRIKIVRSQFNDADLKGALFYGSDLQGSGFQNADLSTANLHNVSAVGADFSGADLRNASIGRRPDFRGAIFDGADLRGMSAEGPFEGSFKGASFEDTKVSPNFARFLTRNGITGFVVSAEDEDFKKHSKEDIDCVYIGDPLYIKTNRCGGFCQGKSRCKVSGITYEEVSLFCASLGDTCPSAEDCLRHTADEEKAVARYNSPHVTYNSPAAAPKSKDTSASGAGQ